MSIPSSVKRSPFKQSSRIRTLLKASLLFFAATNNSIVAENHDTELVTTNLNSHEDPLLTSLFDVPKFYEGLTPTIDPYPSLMDNLASLTDKFYTENIQHPDEINNNLRIAAITGNITALHESIQAGADPNSQNNEGHTALMQASFLGHKNIAKLLLDAKGRP